MKFADFWKHPLDKVGHALMAIGFTAPCLLTPMPWVGVVITAAYFYSREQAQHERKTESYIEPFLPWKWSKDGKFDLIVPVAASIATVLFGSHLLALAVGM